jgi:hypothetical protein
MVYAGLDARVRSYPGGGGAAHKKWRCGPRKEKKEESWACGLVELVSTPGNLENRPFVFLNPFQICKPKGIEIKFEFWTSFTHINKL